MIDFSKYPDATHFIHMDAVEHEMHEFVGDGYSGSNEGDWFVFECFIEGDRFVERFNHLIRGLITRESD